MCLSVVEFTGPFLLEEVVGAFPHPQGGQPGREVRVGPRKGTHLGPDSFSVLCVLSSLAQPVLSLNQGGVHTKMWVK